MNEYNIKKYATSTILAEYNIAFHKKEHVSGNIP